MVLHSPINTHLIFCFSKKGKNHHKHKKWNNRKKTKQFLLNSGYIFYCETLKCVLNMCMEPQLYLLHGGARSLTLFQFSTWSKWNSDKTEDIIRFTAVLGYLLFFLPLVCPTTGLSFFYI